MKNKNYIVDADTGLAFLTGQLSYIESKMYEVKYGNIIYQNIVPISNEAGEGATSITYFYMDGRALTKFVGSNSLDVPVAEIGTNKVVVAVELAATGYQYSDEELRQAILLGIPLPQAKANLARRSYEEFVQRVCMVGDTTYNLPGFINNTNVTSGLVINPGSGTEWVNKTPDEILYDVNTLMGDVYVDSYQVEKPDTLALPTAQWNYIAGTPRSSNSDMTILAWLVANSPYLKSVDSVIAIPELASAGAGSTDRMIAYTKDPDKVVLHIPMPLRFLDPQRKGRGFEIAGESKISGVEFRFPGSAQYGDGI